MVEQLHQVGVVPLVVDDEAGIDGDRPASVVDVDGVGVASQPVIGLEDGDAMLASEGPCGSQSRDPAAHDGDIQRSLDLLFAIRCDRFSLEECGHLCMASRA